MEQSVHWVHDSQTASNNLTLLDSDFETGPICEYITVCQLWL